VIGMLSHGRRRVRHADQAMYAAKAAGRNCARIFGDA
jgi:GGDEF domain-containing protein